MPDQMWVYWLVAAGVLLIGEFLTVGFWMVFFALACFAAFIVALLTDNFIIQLVMFVLVSILSIPFGRPILQKYFEINKEVKPSTINALIGKKGLVTKAISINEYGLVKLDGENWTAKSYNNLEIEEGKHVFVKAIDGVKLIVSEDE